MRRPARVPQAGALRPQVKAAHVARRTNVPLPLSSSVDDESKLSALSSVLILTFGASALLLAVAAMPPAWSVRFGVAAHLADVRGGMALVGGSVLLGSGLAALVLVV